MRFLDDNGRPSAVPAAKEVWVTGLAWSPAPASGWPGRARQARGQGGKVLGCAVVPVTMPALAAPGGGKDKGRAKSQAQVGLGVWTLTFTEEDELRLKLPAHARSVAAAFAVAAAGSGSDTAALYWDLGLVDSKALAYFCSIHGGLPTVDGVFLRERASEQALAAQASGMEVFSNDQDLLALSTPLPAQWLRTWLQQPTFKAARVRAVPANWALHATVAVLALSVAGGGLALQSHQKARKLAELARQEAENDPLPKYQQALAEQSRRAGMSGADLVKLWAQVSQSVATREGQWRLDRVECTVNQCVAKWQRSVGSSFDTLRRARGSDKLMVPAQGDRGQAVATPLESAQTVLSIKPASAVLESTALSSQADYALAAGSLYQRWADARVSVSPITPPALWPDTPGMGGLAAPGLVGRGPIDIAVDAAFATELLAALPPAVRVHSAAWVLQSGGGLRMELKGHHYARLVQPRS